MSAGLEDIFEEYRRKGLAARLEKGERPCVLVIDLIIGFTDPLSPLGANLEEQIQATNRIIKLAHQKGVPVVFTTVAYEEGMADAGLWIQKIPSMKILKKGSRFVELDPRLERAERDILIVKKYASAFFGTSLASLLTSWRIDTLLITGCTTSGCVRASVVDAIQYGFRPLVIREAVGDRAEVPHEVNLLDIDAKYGDVISVGEALGYLSSLPERRSR
jgi:nicotinamidase-related amidase